MNKTLQALSRIADLVLAEVPSDRAIFRVIGPDGETEAEVARGLNGNDSGPGLWGGPDLALAGRVLE
ncbi:MAG: hypothetical protein FJY79_11875, partial [Candidatus Aminicenantes bacterium]|nr:hypothetical protein [Candidatus Aminicenantes bacterium]